MIQNSITLDKYKQTMKECIKLYMPQVTESEMDMAIDYSINKRYKEKKASINNSYTNRTSNTTLLQLADYINERQPIVTAFGTMFQKHGKVKNPLATVIQEFLDKRVQDKKEMFKYPKGSEDFEYYNLLQLLDKIDCNGIYGVLGMFTALIFNVNIATSITAQGRSLISSAIMQFEMFLANNVKFGSLSEVMEFINNVVNEKPERQYRDDMILDNPCVSPEDCFAKVILTCGYRWIPDENEMEVIWRTINNLGQEDLNRVYYKNNLYEFMSNRKMINLIRKILAELKEPFLNPLDPPEEAIPDLEILTSILMEYVYYHYQIIDRTDRTESMIRDVTLISDTDSAIISLDAWYRFILQHTSDMKLDISKTVSDPLYFYKKDEFGDVVDDRYMRGIQFFEPEYDYDFFDDELIEMEHITNPIQMLPQDNIRHSILNIMAYVLDKVNNDYMERYTKNNHSFAEGKKCKIILKNEFTFRRVLLTYVKKSYATLQERQEGEMVPEEKQLDIKGIASMAKSSIAKSTRDELTKILLEDILKAPAIDQFRIVKKIGILEKKIINSLYDGSREFYKPLTIKAMGSYKDPMRIQGIKASVVWNALVDGTDLPKINLDERNAIDVAKVKLNVLTIPNLQEKWPDIYEKAIILMKDPNFKVGITSIAIPLDVKVPDWLLEIVDYNTIINDNIGGFVYESVGIQRGNRTDVNYTNILQL